MSTIISLRAAKAHLSRIVDEVAAGAEIIIAKSGKPMARLVPLDRKSHPKKLGLLEGRIKVPDDFNAPLPLALLADYDGSGDLVNVV